MITDYISAETLAAEGFIHTSDTDAVMAAMFGRIPAAIDRRLEVVEIARWLDVSAPRLRRYIDDMKKMNLWVLDSDCCLSVRQIVAMDWSRLTDQKRTVRLSGSHFQGRKTRKLKTK